VREDQDAVQNDCHFTALVGDVVASQRPDPVADFGPGQVKGLQRLLVGGGAVPITRETVVSAAKGPKTAGSDRSMATSARRSPSRATASARSRRVLPGLKFLPDLGQRVLTLRG